MNTINEKFIKEAEAKQAAFEQEVSWFKNQLEHLSDLIGKCSGTHTFSRDFRNLKNIHSHAMRIDDVFLSKDNNVYHEFEKDKNTITLNDLTPDNIKSACILVQYTSIYIFTSLEGDVKSKEIEVRTNFTTSNHLPYYKVSISSEVFDTLLKAANASVDLYLSKEGRTKLAEEYFYESHYREDNYSRIKTLESLGYKLVKIPNDMQVSRLIDWHPFVYRDMIVLSEESVQLVRDVYNREVDSNSYNTSYCARYGERFRPTSAERDYRELLNYLEKELRK